ncbi:MAG: gliding motility-associated C-terminal domain-containing protein [Ferruginibacter sp.]
MYFNNGKITLTGSTAVNYPGSNRGAQAILEVDELGLVISSKRIENIAVEMDRTSLFRGTMYDVKTFAGVQFQNSDTSDVYVFRLNANQTVRWAWRIPFPDKQIPADIKSMEDSSLVIACTNTTGTSAYASILKTSTLGKVELCTNLNNNITLQNELPIAVDLFLNESNENNHATTATPVSIINGYGFIWQLNCEENQSYKLSKIVGNNLVCAGSTQTYITKRFGNHSTIVNFSCNIPATINRLTDTSIAVQFLQSGNAIIYATMAAPCKTMRDSIVIQINSIGSSINLSADTSICFRNTRQLKVPKGFISYQWQDGSTDSTFLVNTPGQFHISVIDACGNTFKDTIVITTAYMLPFTIGNDRTTCNSDTVQIKASLGFSQYQWLPNYAVVQTNSNQIIVQPGRDTLYTVTALQYPGCTVYDTIYISVKTSPSVLNFPDSTICLGSAIQVNANPGFQKYLWNNGKDSATITIQQAGQYIVTGQYSNGCNSKDTLMILSKQCLEGISFPNAFSPNNDGLNDWYKPISFESIQYYKLTIYNRWGNKVFETNDIQKGWDGKINGIEQNAGAYSFTCQYQFIGKNMLQNNDTFLLLR